MMELKKASAKSKVEAVLFSTGRRLSLDEVCKLCRAKKEEVILALQELKNEYDEKQSSLMLVEDGDYWKFTVRDHFIPIIRKIVTETELPRTVLETLAVIAFKYPVLQSDLIKMRTNKAYDHLVELEQSGYISRQKHGRTNLIKLTEKFFKYFDLTEDKLREKLKDFDSIAKAIEEKETEITQIKAEQRIKAEELKKMDERIKEEIESLDKAGDEFEIQLETYESKDEAVAKVLNDEVSVEKEKIGDLEIVKTDAITSKKEEDKEEIGGHKSKAENQKSKRRKKELEGIKLTPQMETAVDQKVNEMLGIKNESKDENKEQ